ncbi:glycoside hydrolase family 15 protein [Corallococcus exercitus]|uniref:glycoside hydrolase family 15 protein n=1 Tax=Corallococcus exercitus TaxID=2316736 RepID=UPI0035D43197
MDLYSAARRMARPFRFTNPASYREVPLAGRGVIGDGSSCALVRPDGVIDWLCFPRFGSPSVFAGILDDEKGGITGITPSCGPSRACSATTRTPTSWRRCSASSARGPSASSTTCRGPTTRAPLSTRDTAGALLDAAYLYERSGGRLPLRTWRLLRSVIQTTARRWSEPDHGIWEPRREMRHNVHSKLMGWLALRRGQHLARLFGETALEQSSAALADVIRADIPQNGVDPARKHFVGV